MATVSHEPAGRLEAFKRPVFVAAIYTIALRAVYALFAVVLWDKLRPNPQLVSTNAFTDKLTPSPGRFFDTMVGIWERFDTLWYLHIAQYGYDRPAAIVFYPLYPFLIRVVSWLVHPPLLSALLISTLASFFLFWGLQVLVELDLPRGVAIRAVYLVGLWPASFMLFAGYADSAVGAFTVWSLYFARKDKWMLAGLLGMFGGATKAVGGLVALPLALIGWHKKAWSSWTSILSVLPLFAFSIWIRLSGFPTTSEVYSREWKTSVELPWITLAQCVRRFLSTEVDLVFKLNFVFFALLCALALLKRVRTEYTLYATAVLILFLDKKTDPLLQSTMRYLIAVFPAFIGLALLLHKRPVWTVILSLLLLLINTVLLRGFFLWSLLV